MRDVLDLLANWPRFNQAHVVDLTFTPTAEIWVTFVLSGISIAIALVALGSSVSARRKRAVAIFAGAGLVVASLPFFSVGDGSVDKSEEVGFAEARQGIMISPSDDGTVPMCATLSGRAPVVPGTVLWIAYRKEGNGNYHYVPTARNPDDPEGWTASPTTIGDTQSSGDWYRFYGFLASPELSALLGSTHAGIRTIKEDVKPYWYTSALPSGIEDQPLRRFKRGSDTTSCRNSN